MNLENPALMLVERDDAELLAEIGNGSQEAFSCLVHRHSPRYYKLAYRLLRDREDAEDVVQEAFIKIWERPGLWQSDKNAKFATWFYTVVSNLCLDRNKKKRPELLPETWDAPDERETPEEHMQEKQDYLLLVQGLAQLPERQRLAVTLCFLEGLSNQEAAEVLGVKLKALQSLIMRAKTTLKSRLCRHGE